MPKDNEVDEKVIPEGAVAVVSGVWSIMWAGDRSVAHVATKHNLAIGDYLYSPATVAELRAEVERRKDALAAMSQFAKVAEERADAAERRAGELTSLLSDTVGNLHRMANDEFADCDQVRLEHVVNRIEHILTGADPT